MSTSTELVAADSGAVVPAEPAAVVPAPEHKHPEPRQYVMIGVILVIITAIEVAVSYLEGNVNSNLLILVLLALAGVKFFLVVAWFMHLKTDSPLLRRFFIVGLVGAVLLFTIIMLTLHAMQNSYNIKKI
mgnify:FL=1